MNRDTLQGTWMEMKGKVREEWGKLTDNDLDRIAGKREQLVGVLQQHYGWAKEDAERRVEEWRKRTGYEFSEK
ncbi:MAG: CsbD family protein [Gemmatimonadales bacterium]